MHTLPTKLPAGSGQPSAAKEPRIGRWRLRWRRLRRGLLVCAAFVLLVIGPWPADNSSFRGSSYQQRTISTLDTTPVLSEPAGPILVGTAEVDISPPPGHPLAGFTGRKEGGYSSVDSRCFARALTVASGKTRVTILTADLLLINAKLARAVHERTGLSAEEVYFTATHTHSGPGGWGDHVLEKLVAGPYNPQFFDSLADMLADVVRRSRESLTPAEVGVLSTTTTELQTNRLERGAPLDDRLLGLVFRPIQQEAERRTNPKPPLAILTVFSAHATVCGSGTNQLSADYPGELVSVLTRRTHCPAVMFAAGAVAEAAPARVVANGEHEAARVLGRSLADDFNKALAGVRFEKDVPFSTVRVPVDLPDFRFPVSGRWRISPVCSSWISDSRTHLHGLRIGPALLVGFPGDYSGRLAAPLVEWCGNRGLTLFTTSFNGDYKGYFVSQQSFLNIRAYETRDMNFYGPWAGEYLTDLAQRMLERLTPDIAPEAK